MAIFGDKQKTDDKEKRITFAVPEWIHAEAKAKAARERRPLKEVLTELIEQWLRDNPQENK
jgi:hypothetical protein